MQSNLLPGTHRAETGPGTPRTWGVKTGHVTWPSSNGCIQEDAEDTCLNIGKNIVWSWDAAQDTAASQHLWFSGWLQAVCDGLGTV